MSQEDHIQRLEVLIGAQSAHPVEDDASLDENPIVDRISALKMQLMEHGLHDITAAAASIGNALFRFHIRLECTCSNSNPNSSERKIYPTHNFVTSADKREIANCF